MAKRTGRPTKYTKGLATEVCRRIAQGESLRDICRDEAMPHRSTVHLWLLDEEKKEFFDQYEKACNVRAENMFDEIIEIADDGSNDTETVETEDGEGYERTNHEVIQRSRLRVDTRKWYLSKVLPKKFGDKLDLTSGGEKLPKPIYGNLSVQGHNGNAEDIPPAKKN